MKGGHMPALFYCAVTFCSVCGHTTVSHIPPGDNRLRDCCDHCGAVHYVNPRPVVGTIPVWGDQVLLCKRAIEPRLGKWTLPAGFMEVGETTGDGALRETLEEAGARVRLGPLFSMIDVPHVQQVHIFFRAELLDTNFTIGTESGAAISAPASAGSKGHFRVTVVSEQFAGMSRLERHRLIQGILAPLFETDIHALALITRAPGESL